MAAKKKEGGCSRCGHPLTDPESIARCMGPVCRTLPAKPASGNVSAEGLTIKLQMDFKRWGDRMRWYHFIGDGKCIIVRLWNDEDTGQRLGVCAKCQWTNEKCAHLIDAAAIDDIKFDKQGNFIKEQTYDRTESNNTITV